MGKAGGGEPVLTDQLCTPQLDGRVAPEHWNLLVVALARLDGCCELLRCSGQMAGSGPGRWVALGGVGSQGGGEMAL